MLKAFLRSAPNRALDILSDTMIGRTLLRQVVALARKKLGFELDIQPQPGERDLWLVTAWVDDKPIPTAELLPLLLTAMRKEEKKEEQIISH